MNRTTKINILSYASQPDKSYKYEGDLVEYNGKRYWVSLMNETVEFVGEITERYLFEKELRAKVGKENVAEAWEKIKEMDPIDYINSMSPEEIRKMLASNA